MNEWKYLTPADSFGPLRYKIVNALVPTRAMLGPKHLVVCARRMPDAQCWEVRYATKRFWQRWPKFPLIEKGMAEFESLKHFYFVRETQTLADSLKVSADFLGDDCRVVACSLLDHRPWVSDEEIGKFVRKIWYVRNDNPLDGIDCQPDVTCISPRGHSLAYRRIPSPEAVAHGHKRHADYAKAREAKSKGLVHWQGVYYTPQEYANVRRNEPCRH